MSPLVLSTVCHPVPLGIDAFAHPWLDLRLYAFPPIKLIPAGLCQGEGVRSPSPADSPFLAIPDVVFGASLP